MLDAISRFFDTVARAIAEARGYAAIPAGEYDHITGALDAAKARAAALELDVARLNKAWADVEAEVERRANRKARTIAKREKGNPQL